MAGVSRLRYMVPPVQSWCLNMASVFILMVGWTNRISPYTTGPLMIRIPSGPDIYILNEKERRKFNAKIQLQKDFNM